MAARSGVSSGATIRGLPEFRRELRALGPEWPRELRKANKNIAQLGAHYAQVVAHGMGGVQAKAASAIRGYANQREARIGVVPSARVPFANVAFWGAKRHTGWYERARYNDSPRQHPEWVGNTWDVAEHGVGPYAINEALAEHIDDILDEYGEAIDRLAARAFPDR